LRCPESNIFKLWFGAADTNRRSYVTVGVSNRRPDTTHAQLFFLVIYRIAYLFDLLTRNP
jgi:hypothetical protein